MMPSLSGIVLPLGDFLIAANPTCGKIIALVLANTEADRKTPAQAGRRVAVVD
jgi:hypothetical protein